MALTSIKNCNYKCSDLIPYEIRWRDLRGHDRVVVTFIIPIQSMPITTNVVSSTGRWFSLVTPVSSTNKTDCHNITEKLLKVALNIINQTNHNNKNS